MQRMSHVPATVLGSSGVPATRIGLGMAALGRPGYINLGHRDDLGRHRDPAALGQRAHQVLDAAYAAGVRYVDCARSYGRAEEFVATWLASLPSDVRRGVTVGSKWGYRYTAGWRDDADVHEVKEHTRAHLDTQWAETRALLGDAVRLYQIHSATEDSGVLDDADVLDGLAALKDQGIAIGLSTSGPRQHHTIRRAVGLGLFDTVQSTFNVLEPSAGEALEAAHRQGMGVIVKEAVANGRLTSRGDTPRFAAAAAARGTTPDALALAWVLAHPFVDCVLSGAATVTQLHENLAALDVGVTPDDLDDLAVPADDYWTYRGGLSWT